MKMRPLGATGIEVTPIGLGMAALGRPGYINLGHGADFEGKRSVEDLRGRAQDMLDRAHAAGIRYLDAARSYGRAEEFVAGWLAADPDRARTVTVGSKWGYTYTADWRVDADEHEVKDHSVTTFERQIDETRANFGDHLDLYQIHSATLATGVLEDPEVLAALTALAGTGVVIGLSLSGPNQARTLEHALEVAAAGRAPFASVQATWNLLEPSAGPALQAAHEAGWGVIVKEAVANGRLTARGEVPAAAVEIAERHRVGVDAVAIAAALAQPFTSVVLSGATTPAQLASNLDATGLELTSDDLAALAAVGEVPAEYWAHRGELAWS